MDLIGTDSFRFSVLGIAVVAVTVYCILRYITYGKKEIM